MFPYVATVSIFSECYCNATFKEKKIILIRFD